MQDTYPFISRVRIEPTTCETGDKNFVGTKIDVLFDCLTTKGCMFLDEIYELLLTVKSFKL